MRIILHLSDLHITGKPHTDIRVQQLFQKVLQRWSGKEKPLIVITGDIVDDGKEKQFQVAAELMRTLRDRGFLLYPIPGNHDYGWHGSIARSKKFELFKKYLLPGQHIAYPWTPEPIDHIALIGLNSMAAEADLRQGGLLADGELGANQIRLTQELIRQIRFNHPQRKIVIFLHHHPFIFPQKSWIGQAIEYAGHRLKDGVRFMKAIQGQVDYLLFGHDHLHLNFSAGTSADLSQKYRIPVILSCGSVVKDNLPGWIIHANGTVENF